MGYGLEVCSASESGLIFGMLGMSANSHKRTSSPFSVHLISLGAHGWHCQSKILNT